MKTAKQIAVEVYHAALCRAEEEGFERDILDVAAEFIPAGTSRCDMDTIYEYVNTRAFQRCGVI